MTTLGSIYYPKPKWSVSSIRLFLEYYIFDYDCHSVKSGPLECHFSGFLIRLNADNTTPIIILLLRIPSIGDNQTMWPFLACWILSLHFTMYSAASRSVGKVLSAIARQRQSLVNRCTPRMVYRVRLRLYELSCMKLVVVNQQEPICLWRGWRRAGISFALTFVACVNFV